MANALSAKARARGEAKQIVAYPLPLLLCKINGAKRKQDFLLLYSSFVVQHIARTNAVLQ